jgi:hypothetical protein
LILDFGADAAYVYPSRLSKTTTRDGDGLVIGHLSKNGYK